MTRFLIATCVAAVLLVLATSSGAQPAPEAAPTEDAASASEAAPPEATAPVAPAPVTVTVPEEPGEVANIVGKITQAAKDGNWSLVFVLAIMVLVWGARALATKWSKLGFLTTKWGGWGLVMVGTAAATVATVLLAGDGITWALLSSAITYGLAAAGAHELHGDSGLKGA